MDSPASAPPKRGFPVYALVIVVVIIIVAAVALQVARQRVGQASWGAGGLTPRGVAPRCLWPSDAAYVAGKVDVYPGVPGFTDACYSQRVGAPGRPVPAADAARLLGAPAVRAACGAGPLWYQGSGTYACRPRRDGFDWEPKPSSRENYDQRYRRRLHRDGFIGGAIPCLDCPDRMACEHLDWDPECEWCYGGAQKRETFSPDMPGTCCRPRSPAAAYELAALRVAAGQ